MCYQLHQSAIADAVGVEPTSNWLEPSMLSLHQAPIVAGTGVEPISLAYEASNLPFNISRVITHIA